MQPTSLQTTFCVNKCHPFDSILVSVVLGHSTHSERQLKKREAPTNFGTPSLRMRTAAIACLHPWLSRLGGELKIPFDNATTLTLKHVYCVSGHSNASSKLCDSGGLPEVDGSMLLASDDLRLVPSHESMTTEESCLRV